jgi:hypothetical protein
MHADISMQRPTTYLKVFQFLTLSHTYLILNVSPLMLNCQKERRPATLITRLYRMKIHAYLESSQRGEGKRFIDKTLARAGLPLSLRRCRGWKATCEGHRQKNGGVYGPPTRYCSHRCEDSRTKSKFGFGTLYQLRVI